MMHNNPRLLGALAYVLCAAVACNGTVDFADEPGDMSGDMSGAVDCAQACVQGQTCVNGLCVFDAPPGSADMGMNSPMLGAGIGQACTVGEDCSGALCLNDVTLPGGYCSKICGTGLPGVSDRCAEGAVCVQVDGGASACFASCAADTECREGYICDDVNQGRKVCLPACLTDQDCGFDEVCDASGRCSANDTMGAGRVGGSCVDGMDCTGGICFDESGDNWPGGTCSESCLGQADRAFCDGASASSGLCLVLDAETSLCLPSCTTSTDCREQYVCSVDEGDANPQGYGFCLPGCSWLPCQGEKICDVSGLCVEPMGTGSPQDVETRVLGTFSLSQASTERLTIDVPADALSFGFTFESDSPTQGVAAVRQLIGPTGETLYDIFNPLQSSMKYFDGQTSPTALIYPNAPSLNLSPGQYTLVLGAYSQANITVHLHVKTGDSPTQQRLPMTFWFMDNPYFKADSARSSPAFQAAVNQMVSIYASVGVEVSPIEYRDAPASTAAQFTAFDIDANPIELVIGSVIGRQPAAGAHMFFNDQLFTRQGQSLYGVSGGLPGPPAVNDTPSAGVFVALNPHDLNGQIDSSELSVTMAHELGHYLGLFHISEADGSSHDPLSDTDQCYDQNFDGSVSGSECGTSGANMMYWTSDPGFTHDRVSPAQRWVIHRNLALFE